MTLRDILCSSCSDVALSVDESRSADEVERNTGETYCLGCGAKGDVRVRDDGQACDLQFRAGEDLALDLKLSLRGLIALQVAEEQERQRGWKGYASDPRRGFYGFHPCKVWGPEGLSE